MITTNVGVPTLKKQPECVCPNCQRNMAASRFAPHLEKCMGMGRNSSRLASRRIASNNKDNCYRESGGNEDEEDAEDEDWVEPGNTRMLFGGSSSGSSNSGNSRRKRDKNSPRRTKASRTGVSCQGQDVQKKPQKCLLFNTDSIEMKYLSIYVKLIIHVNFNRLDSQEKSLNLQSDNNG